MIKGKGIVKAYKEVNIINKIDVEFNSGEITVLIGSSGSGKTTLLKSLSLLESPDEGTISIDELTFNFPLKQKIRSQFKYTNGQMVGVVFQNLDLIPHWTNRENILRPLNGNTNNLIFNELAVLIDKFRIHPFIDKFPQQCSKGEQQRIAFVRAVMLRPKYLFLDEITSALDPELIAILFKYLLELKKKGVGIFVITHFLLFAQNVADKVIFLKEGKVVEEGSSEIMKNPQTPQLFDFLNSIKGIILNED